MTAIKATWNGNGLPDGTALSSSNVNTTGNSFGSGVNWTLVGTGASDGVWAAETSGDGFRYTTEASGMVMLRSIFPDPPTGVRAQAIVTIPADGIISGSTVGVIQAYNGSAQNQGWVRLSSSHYFEFYRSATDLASRSPQLPVGSKALIDVVYHVGASASRFFYRVTNLSDPGWNGSGHFFYDTGYTLPAGTVYGMLQFGKSTTGTAVLSPGILVERVGAEAITVSESATSEAAASAYFADEPGDPLPTPVVTITGTANPSGPGVADGSITASWPSVPGATSYQAGIATGDALEGFTLVASGVTSPYTWGSLAGGTYTIAVRAVP